MVKNSGWGSLSSVREFNEKDWLLWPMDKDSLARTRNHK